MERLSLYSSASAAKTYEDGTIVTAQKIEPKRPIPGRVAKHEADHVVPARKIIDATIIAHGNALGTTRPVEMTAAAAAGPDAMGHDGTGHDMFIVEYVMGIDPNAARAAGLAALSGKEEERYEVATRLEEKKTIYQKDVDEAFEVVKKRRQGIHPVVVEFRLPDGKVQTHTTETFHNEVKISDLLPKAA